MSSTWRLSPCWRASTPRWTTARRFSSPSSARRSGASPHVPGLRRAEPDAGGRRAQRPAQVVPEPVHARARRAHGENATWRTSRRRCSRRYRRPRRSGRLRRRLARRRGEGAGRRSFARAGAPWEFNLRDVLRWCELAGDRVSRKSRPRGRSDGSAEHWSRSVNRTKIIPRAYRRGGARATRETIFPGACAARRTRARVRHASVPRGVRRVIDELGAPRRFVCRKRGPHRSDRR